MPNTSFQAVFSHSFLLEWILLVEVTWLKAEKYLKTLEWQSKYWQLPVCFPRLPCYRATSRNDAQSRSPRVWQLRLSGCIVFSTWRIILKATSCLVQHFLSSSSSSSNNIQLLSAVQGGPGEMLEGNTAESRRGLTALQLLWKYFGKNKTLSKTVSFGSIPKAAGFTFSGLWFGPKVEHGGGVLRKKIDSKEEKLQR